ncbi:transketolase C-terminal domain-containing protein [Colwellia sp. UCD-KL20]|uniref:alpha-ketoacid dehydrogenase subunit beta n=1 Tax=Colwellia sp. UCD-KL20 TaxID=1917165 RepID=UPI0009714B47|nr:transketolase C-terminal domain-containing protein [Colwellia sp. UCD-KL20]
MLKETHQISFAEAINETTEQLMSYDESIICYGLGVNDPGRIFNTTKNLVETFGEQRVFDMPTAENGMLGIGIGAAIAGLKPIIIFQRVDFFLLAMDQLVNNAAKWRFMFGGQSNVPITIRLIIGRGWGQGPTHSQSLQAWFAHIPGLKVVMPSTTEELKQLLTASVLDPNPVIILEHRWLYQQKGNVPIQIDNLWLLSEQSNISTGDELTVVSSSYLTTEAKIALKFLQEHHEISIEHITLSVLAPLNTSRIIESVEKTGRLLLLESAHETCSISSSISHQVAASSFDKLKLAPVVMAKPDWPEPTTYSGTKYYYISAYDIAQKICEMLAITLDIEALQKQGHHDVPGDWFTGPF